MIRWKPSVCRKKRKIKDRLNVYCQQSMINNNMKSNNPFPERIWDGYHFSRSLKLGPNLYFVFSSFSLALKMKQLIQMYKENKAMGFRTPLTWQMVLDLERQHKEKIRREEREKIILEEVKAKYGGIPEWLIPHLPPDYDLESRLESISNDLKVIRQTPEDPITC
jgi:hypothetical protein